MERRSVRVSDKQWSAWARAAASTGLNRGEWIRRACDDQAALEASLSQLEKEVGGGEVDSEGA